MGMNMLVSRELSNIGNLSRKQIFDIPVFLFNMHIINLFIYFSVNMWNPFNWGLGHLPHVPCGKLIRTYQQSKKFGHICYLHL